MKKMGRAKGLITVKDTRGGNGGNRKGPRKGEPCGKVGAKIVDSWKPPGRIHG